MFGVSTLVREEVGDDYKLQAIADVNNDNMTIVCMIQRLTYFTTLNNF